MLYNISTKFMNAIIQMSYNNPVTTLLEIRIFDIIYDSGPLTGLFQSVCSAENLAL